MIVEERLARAGLFACAWTVSLATADEAAGDGLRRARCLRAPDRYAEIADLLLEAARLKATDEALEVGSGTGLLTAAAAPMVRSLVASDLSLPMLECAHQALGRMPKLKGVPGEWRLFADAS